MTARLLGNKQEASCATNDLCGECNVTLFSLIFWLDRSKIYQRSTERLGDAHNRAITMDNMNF